MVNRSGTLHYDYGEIIGQDGFRGTHFVQGALDRMVIGGLENTSTLSVASWRDADAEMYFSSIPISSISTIPHSSIDNLDFSAPAPDGTEWYGVLPNYIYGAAFRPVSQVERDEFLFSFGAGRDVASGFPYPYVRIETVQMDWGDTARIGHDVFVGYGEHDVWNPDYAWGMASVGVQEESVGLTVTAGGGTFGYPQFTVGYMGDWNPVINAYVLYTVTGGNATQCFVKSGNVVSRYGDYVNMRPIPGTADFATLVYENFQAIPGLSCDLGGFTTVMRYVRFGRP